MAGHGKVSVGAWVGIGMTAGAAFGVAIENIALGVGVGAAIGLALGHLLRQFPATRERFRSGHVAPRSPGRGWRLVIRRALARTPSPQGGLHDGRLATLRDVVDHYDSFLQLGLTAAEKTDLIEYLKSL